MLRKEESVSKSSKWVPYLLLLPAILVLVLLRVVPALAGFTESLYIHNLSAAKRAFVGLDNFERLFQDPGFWKSFRITLVFNLVVNPLQTALAFALALLVNQQVRGITVFRTAFLIPVVISINITSTVWGLLLNKDLGPKGVH